MKWENIKDKILYIALIIIVSIVACISCSPKQEKPAPEKTKEEIPSYLETISDNTEEVIKSIEKMQEEKKKPVKPEKQSNKGEGDTEENQQQEQQSEDSSDQSKSSSEKESKDMKQMLEEAELKKQETIEKMQKDISEKVKKIHSAWNDYEMQAVDDGAAEEDIKKFEDSLNGLTIAVENKEDMKSIDMANELMYYTARFFDFYKGNIDSEMNRIKYYIRKTYLDGQKNEWSKAEQDMKNIPEVFNKFIKKIKLDKKDEKLIEKLNMSIQDMEDVIKNKNEELLKIKRDIVIDNLEAIGEAAK